MVERFRYPEGASLKEKLEMRGHTEIEVVPELGPCHELNGIKRGNRAVISGVPAGRIVLDIVDDSEVWACHHCDNITCIRESHLYRGNPSVNLQDSYARGKKKPYAGEGKGESSRKRLAKQ